MAVVSHDPEIIAALFAIHHHRLMTSLVDMSPTVALPIPSKAADHLTRFRRLSLLRDSLTASFPDKPLTASAIAPAPHSFDGLVESRMNRFGNKGL